MFLLASTRRTLKNTMVLLTVLLLQKCLAMMDLDFLHFQTRQISLALFKVLLQQEVFLKGFLMTCTTLREQNIVRDKMLIGMIVCFLLVLIQALEERLIKAQSKLRHLNIWQNLQQEENTSQQVLTLQSTADMRTSLLSPKVKPN